MIKQSLFIIALFAGASAFGQEVISSSGQTHSSGQLIVSQTIGEAFVETLSNGITVNQGFHQNQSIITGIFDREETLELAVYPNPFVERIVISGQEELGSISVYSISGQELLQQPVQKGQTTAELQLSHLSSGQYMVRVTAVNRLKSNTYSIIKQ